MLSNLSFLSVVLFNLRNIFKALNIRKLSFSVCYFFRIHCVALLSIEGWERMNFECLCMGSKEHQLFSYQNLLVYSHFFNGGHNCYCGLKSFKNRFMMEVFCLFLRCIMAIHYFSLSNVLYVFVRRAPLTCHTQRCGSNDASYWSRLSSRVCVRCFLSMKTEIVDEAFRNTEILFSFWRCLKDQVSQENHIKSLKKISN